MLFTPTYLKLSIIREKVLFYIYCQTSILICAEYSILRTRGMEKQINCHLPYWFLTAIAESCCSLLGIGLNFKNIVVFVLKNWLLLIIVATVLHPSREVLSRLGCETCHFDIDHIGICSHLLCQHPEICTSQFVHGMSSTEAFL